MDETANEIEAHIDRTRERIGSNLKELEDKVDAATDWREQFQKRPYVMLGAAVVGGALLATALRPKSPRQISDGSTALGLAAVPLNGDSPRAQVLELWTNVQRALVGVATTRVKEYVGELVPGFEEQLRRLEHRTSPDAASAQR